MPNRPEQRSMVQLWRDLLFLHWPVSVEVLRPLVPEPLEIDTFEGTAYVGLVPFAMRGVRPSWAPAVPGLSDFLEVNVRTYVRGEGLTPGVWFFSLDAGNPVAVLIARTAWHLPYFKASMQLRHSAGQIHYHSERRWPGPRPAGCDIRYHATGEPCPAVAGSLEQFLVERYILYTRRRGRLLSGRVEHRPYPVQAARLEGCEESLVRAAGIERPGGMPPLVHYAAGVDVNVFALRDVSDCRPPRPARSSITAGGGC